MNDGYYFRLPRTEVNKVVLRTGAMFAIGFVGLRLFDLGSVDTAVFLALALVGMYFVLLHYKFVFISSNGICAESPFGKKILFAWSDRIVISERSINELQGYMFTRDGRFDSIFVPKAIFISPLFHDVVAKYSPCDHVILSRINER